MCAWLAVSPRPAVGRTYEPLLIFSFFFFFGVSALLGPWPPRYRGFEIYTNAQLPTGTEFYTEHAAWWSGPVCVFTVTAGTWRPKILVEWSADLTMFGSVFGRSKTKVDLKYIYVLIPRSRVLLEKLTSFQLVKKFPTFNGTWSFVKSFTSARHLSLSWASSIQSIPASHFPKIHLNIILLSTLGSSNELCPSGFPTKTLYAPLLSTIRDVCP